MYVESAIRVAQALGLALLLGACSASRIENGTFYSPKGYQIQLPGHGWRVQANGEADLELRREAPTGGMLVNATCEGKPLQQPLSVLVRHLTFGLKNRHVVESDANDLAGQPGAHVVVRGTMDGRDVAVEAWVVKTGRCIHDFLYVAPVAEFEAGRNDFKAFVESFTRDAR